MTRKEITIPIKPAIRPDGQENDIGMLVSELAAGIQGRLLQSSAHIRETAEEIRSLETRTRWLKDLSATLKNKVAELEAAAKALEAEAEEVEKKMLGKGQEPITERVDAAHLEKVAAARAMP